MNVRCCCYISIHKLSLQGVGASHEFYTTENWGLAGERVIQRSFLGTTGVAGLLLRLSVLSRQSTGMSGSGMVGASPGLALRLSILLCMRELLTGLWSVRSGILEGSEKGLSDAVRIWGGGTGMMGMMEPDGLGGCEDWKLLRRFSCRWRRNTINPATRAATKTAARMLIPMTTDLDTPPLDDDAVVESEPAPAVDVTGRMGPGILGELVDVDDPVLVPVLVTPLDVVPTLLEITLTLLELLVVGLALLKGDVGVDGSDVDDVELALDVGDSGDV